MSLFYKFEFKKQTEYRRVDYVTNQDMHSLFSIKINIVEFVILYI